MRSRKRLLAIAALSVAAFGVYWYIDHYSTLTLQEVLSFGMSAEQFAARSAPNTFSAPPPLTAARVPAPPGASGRIFTLTRAGVIAQTNARRSGNGALPPLAENEVLDAIATLRLDDMFQNQYFAHVSPYTSSSAETVAKTVGYQYISLGENLALGNFVGDKGVVDAWMESPGHRANILGTHYAEIGVAARKGVFEGESTWIAVQVFGRPSSDCAAPDAALRASIDADQSSIIALGGALAQEKSEIDAMQPKYGEAYNAKVDDYNTRVARYNVLIEQVKSEAAGYNAQVAAFNACIGA